MQLSNMGIKIDDAISFVATIRYQSISRAADVLGITQPSVTRRIQALEEALGVILLDRNTRPPKPTAIGLRVFEKCRDLIKEAEAIKSLVDLGETPKGIIRIGMTQRIAEMYLGELLQTFSDRYPDLTVQAITRWSAELRDMVIYNDIHAAIVQSPVSSVFPKELSFQELLPIKIVIVAPKGRYPQKNITLAECVPGEWILNPEGCVFRRTLINALEDKSLPYKLTMDGFGTELQMQLVARGLGLGLLPLPCVVSSAYYEQVDILDVTDFSIESALWLIQNATLSNLKPAVDACGQSIAEALKKLIANAKTK